MARRFILAILVAVLGTPLLARDTYRVTVTRKEANLYKIDGTKTFIKTKYCYEYVYAEDALLTYQPKGLDNKLIFDKRPLTTSCAVESLLTEDR